MAKYENAIVSSKGWEEVNSYVERILNKDELKILHEKIEMYDELKKDLDNAISEIDIKIILDKYNISNKFKDIVTEISKRHH